MEDVQNLLNLAKLVAVTSLVGSLELVCPCTQQQHSNLTQCSACMLLELM